MSPAAGDPVPTSGEPVAAPGEAVAAPVTRPARGGAPRSRRGRKPDAVTSTSVRPTGLRLARVHLRMGSLALARAELESFAGRGTLDEPALLDLAEVRWRTGDLAGAGEAANVLLATGRDDALALVIAAEAVAALGRPGEARRLAGRALEAAAGPVDPLFAGMPRSLIWPGEAAIAPEVPETAPGHPVGEHAGRAPRPARPRPGVAAPVTDDEAEPASPAAAEAFAGGRAALSGGDVGHAALRLGVALRLEPGFAEAVLEAIGDRPGDPSLALVAGDALRLLGRESEALAAYDRARGHDDQRPVPGNDTLPGADPRA